MAQKLNENELKTLPDQELFNLLNTDAHDAIVQELRDRGYSSGEISEASSRIT